ncbi:MAG: magnesium transporter MgtE N-terminal domain-containing protein [Halorhodospira sp.]
MSVMTEHHEHSVSIPARAEYADRLPAAAARRILRMEPAERPAALEAMPEGEGLATFLEMRPDAQASVLEHMALGPAARLANRLPFNTLARVLDHMDGERRNEIVRNLRPLKRSRVETVLSNRLQ